MRDLAFAVVGLACVVATFLGAPDHVITVGLMIVGLPLVLDAARPHYEPTQPMVDLREVEN